MIHYYSRAREMRNTSYIAIITLVILIFASQGAHAGAIFTITNVADANGSIGIYIKNEIGVLMQTDNSKYDKNVLVFYVNDSNTSVNSDKTPTSVPREGETLVVLNKPWPTAGYYKISATYKDASGGFYPQENYLVFAV